MLSTYVLPLLLAGLAWPPAHAAPLYKWVDSAGQVIYSSSPPPAGTRVEKVQAPPQPSAEEVRQTEERTKKIEEQANVLETPVYAPQPLYYPPVMRRPPKRHPDKHPHPRPRPDLDDRRRAP